MRSTRVVAAVAASLTVLTLGLTGCGGGGGGDSEKQALVDSLMNELSGDGTITEDQKSCLRGKFDEFTVDELNTLKNSQNDSEVPQALQEKVINMVMECVMPTDAAS